MGTGWEQQNELDTGSTHLTGRPHLSPRAGDTAGQRAWTPSPRRAECEGA